MTSIDERVVKMKMDDSQFTAGANRVSSSLDLLKQRLNFKGASKGLENIDAAAKAVNFSSMQSGIESINSKFSALGVVAATVLSKITSAAITAGHTILNTLTQGVRGGFQEYETQMGAVQTILANTASKGSTIEQVNSALNTLNTYADKTIYNFTEMTKNIGTFTAAGVDLQTSVESIQGIANLAAMSGSTSMQASTAMYQLSQAIAAGTVRLMDWNSVVNAGMGGEVFQSALIRTSEHLRTGAKDAIKAEGSFRESLSKGWLTSQVLTETLSQFALTVDTAEDYNNAIKDLVDQGYTQEEAKAIADMAKTAGDAATKVKTFSQLIDTLKEAIGSGWTQSWQTMIGDFDESKELWTSVNDVLSKLVQNSSNARNALLSSGLSSGWKQFLDQGIEDSSRFKDTLSEVAREHGVAIDDMVTKEGSLEKTFHQGWVTGEMLKESVSRMTEKMAGMSKEELKAAGYTNNQVRKMQELNQKIQEGSINVDEYAKKISMMSGRENIIKGLGNAFGSLTKVVETVHKAFRDVFPPMTGEKLYDLTVKFKEFSETLKPSKTTLDDLRRTFKGLFSVLDIVKQGITGLARVFTSFAGNTGGIFSSILSLTAAVGDFFSKFDESIKKKGAISGFFDAVSYSVAHMTKYISRSVESFTGLGNAMSDIGSTIGDKVSSIFTKISDKIKSAVDWFSKNVHFSAGDIFAGLAGGGIFLAAGKIISLVDKVRKTFDDFVKNLKSTADKSQSISSQFSDALGTLQKSLSAFTSSIRAVTLLEIATGVTMLVFAMERIAKMNPEDIAKGAGTIAILMTELNLSMRSLAKTISKFNVKGIVRIGLATMAFAEAINILASAMQKFDNLDFGDILKGLSSIGVLMLELSFSMKLLSKSVPLQTSIGLLAMAEAVSMLVKPIKDLSKLSWEEVGKGLASVSGAMLAMSGSMKILGLGKSSGLGGAIGMVVLAEAMTRIAKPLKSLGHMDWPSIGKGLTAMGGALAEMSISLIALGKIAGFSSLFAGGAIFIVAKGLGNITDSLRPLGSMSWESVGKGLAAMGGALAEISLMSGTLGKIAGLSSILGAGAIWLVVQSLNDLSKSFKNFGSMKWDAVARASVGMGGALAEIALLSGALGKIAGLSSILGAGSIWLVVQSLDDLSKSFKNFGSMKWDEIGRGLTGMGGALTELSVVTGALGSVAGLQSALGSVDIMLAVKPLDILASALKKFGSMKWDEIGRGLTAMGGALIELSVVTGALGWVAGFAGLVGAGVLDLAVQGLGTLADAVSKFASMDWISANQGIQLMLQAMGATGLGALMNTFSGFGADAIATVAAPLGQLADSVMKWNGVTVPSNLSDQLGQLANGIMKFTFGGIGAWALASAAPALDTLANAVRNWSTVTVPDGLESQLVGLSNGVQAFSWAFMGGWSLSAVVGPLGDLADSMKKWNGVIIPDNLETSLRSLSNGVQAFSWAFMGGWSLSAITGPLGDLAGSVRKWNGVSIPDGLRSGLQSLSDGVKSFSWAFMGGWSLSAITGPLGDLAGAVKRWNGVAIPDGITSGLSALANGVKSFSGAMDATSVISALGSSLTSLSFGVSIAASSDMIGVGARLQQLVEVINSQPPINSQIPMELNDFSVQLSISMYNVVSTVSSGSSQLGASFLQLRSSITDSMSGMSSIATSEMNSMASGISSGGAYTMASLAALAISIAGFSQVFSSSFDSIVSSSRIGLTLVALTIDSFKPRFDSSGRSLGNAVKEGMSQASSGYASAVTGGMGSAVGAISSYYGAFFNAGRYATSGIANGMLQNRDSVIGAGTNLGNAALEAAKRALQEHSPSKAMHKIGEFADEGLANGMLDNVDTVKNSSSDVASSTMDAIREELSKSEYLDDLGTELSPTITPILDLSSVKDSSKQLSSLLPNQLPIGESWRLASQLSSANSNQNEKNSNNAPIVQKVTKNYNYHQTINSPKEPSRIDIYRDSKNLLNSKRFDNGY